MVGKYKQTLIRLGLVAAISFVLSFMLFAPAKAQPYGQGDYGRGEYGTGETEDEVSNTGQALVYVVPAGLILAGTIGLYKARTSSKSRKNRNDRDQ